VPARQRRFSSISRNVNPNSLLRDAGFIDEEGGKLKSWRALIRSSGGSGSVYVKDLNEIPRVRDSLLAGSAIDGELRYAILDRSQLDKLGYNPEAALALEPAEGWALTERLGPSTPTVRGNHGQLPTRPGLQTGFLAEGAGIRRGAVIERMGLIDIAPTVALLLGLEMKGVDGVPLEALLR
jgi:hypothetical protein